MKGKRACGQRVSTTHLGVMGLNKVKKKEVDKRVGGGRSKWPKKGTLGTGSLDEDWLWPFRSFLARPRDPLAPFLSSSTFPHTVTSRSTIPISLVRDSPIAALLKPSCIWRHLLRMVN